MTPLPGATGAGSRVASGRASRLLASGPMDDGARFPAVAEKAGHYESFYVKACRPGGGEGIWIRHTVHKRPGAEPKGSIWFTHFDREADGPRATKVTVPAAELSSPEGGWIRVDGAEIGPGRAEGAVATEAVKARWSSTFAGDDEPCKYLPADWLYDAPVPRTKFVAPFPNARFDGRLEIDGEEGRPRGLARDDRPQLGLRARRALGLARGDRVRGAADSWFDAGAARIKLGRWTTSWVPSGMLVLDGERHRLGGLGKVRSARISESPTACEFVLPGKDIDVRGRVSAAAKDFVGWVYADPKGPEHNTLNCSIADLELTVERKGSPPRTLSLPGGAAYEFGMRETDHGIPIQPYPDG